MTTSREKFHADQAALRDSRAGRGKPDAPQETPERAVQPDQAPESADDTTNAESEALR